MFLIRNENVQKSLGVNGTPIFVNGGNLKLLMFKTYQFIGISEKDKDGTNEKGTWSP